MKRVFSAVLALACSCRLAGADAETCRAATEQYQSVLDEVSDAIRAYATCIYDSQGGDNCASEFAELREAQDHFESAVALYQSECQ